MIYGKMKTRWQALNKITGACLLIALLGWTPQSLQAQRTLTVQNLTAVPQTITLEWGNCFDNVSGLTPNGQVFENVQVNGTIEIVYSRKMGHGCDGEQGWFNLKFEPGLSKHKKNQWFHFNSDEVLAMNNHANKIGGNLNWLAGFNVYFYSTPRVERLTAGPVKGYWELLCTNNCNFSVTSGVTNLTIRTTEVSNETKKAISLSIETGMEYGGASAKYSLTGSLEESIKNTMINTLSVSKSESNTKNVVFTPKTMGDNNIYAVWQWVGKTTMSDGSVILLKTREYTCTSDRITPDYVPGDAKDIGSCTGALKK